MLLLPYSINTKHNYQQSLHSLPPYKMLARDLTIQNDDKKNTSIKGEQRRKQVSEGDSVSVDDILKS